MINKTPTPEESPKNQLFRDSSGVGVLLHNLLETGELELIDRVTFDTHMRIQKAPGNGIQKAPDNGIESVPHTVSKVHPSIKQYINKDKLGRNGAALQDNPSKKVNKRRPRIKVPDFNTGAPLVTMI